MMTDRKVIEQALYDGIAWQLALMDSYNHIRDDPAYGQAQEMVRMYRSCLKRKYVPRKDPVAGAKPVGLDELRKMKAT